MIGDCRVVHFLNERVLTQEVEYFDGVFDVAFQAERKGFDPLKKEERVEGGDGGAHVAQKNGADVGDKRGRARGVGERDAVITRVRRGDVRVAFGIPLEFARIDNDSAEGGSVPADELGGGMDDDVGAVFDRTDQIRGSEGVVDDQRNVVRVRQFGERLDVGNVAVRVAERFDEDGFGFGTDRGLDFFEVVDVDQARLDSVTGECVGEEVERAAVDRLLGDDMFPLLGERLDCVRDGGCPRRNRECPYAPFERSEPFFEDFLRRVGEPAVDVARVGQTETRLGVFGIVKDVRGGLVDRYCPCIGGGISFFLPDMELERFEFIWTHQGPPLG